MIDGIGRKIDYLRLSITDRCNLRCRYCMPEDGVAKCSHEQILRYEEILQILRVLVPMGIEKIRLTGGEPLVRRGILSLIKEIKGIEGVKTLTLTTNGLLLKDMAQSLKEAGIDRVNVSLDTLQGDKYQSMTRGGDLHQALAGIEAAKAYGLTPIKLNTVLIGGYNDDEIEAFGQWTMREAIDVRFIELMPMGEVVSWNKEQFIPAETVLNKLPALEPVAKEDPSAPADLYQLPGAKGRVGIIRPISCKFCSSCNRIRLTSDGKLKYCLHSDHELDLKKVMAEGGDIRRAVEGYLKVKPQEHYLEQEQYLKKSMFRIGG